MQMHVWYRVKRFGGSWDILGTVLFLLVFVDDESLGDFYDDYKF